MPDFSFVLITAPREVLPSGGLVVSLILSAAFPRHIVWERRVRLRSPQRSRRRILRGAFRKVARPSSKAITASSVTSKSTGRTDVIGSEHVFTIFGLPLAVCCMATITRLAPRHEIHRAAHARAPSCRGSSSWRGARPDRPAGRRAPSGRRWPPRIRPNDIALSNVLAPGSAVTGRPPASVSSRVRHAFFGRRAGADQSVLGLEKDVHPAGTIVRDQRRDPDAEIDQHAGAQFPRDAPVR